MSEAESAGVLSSEALVNLRPFLHGVGKDEDPFEVSPGLDGCCTMAGGVTQLVTEKLQSDLSVSVMVMVVFVATVVVVVVVVLLGVKVLVLWVLAVLALAVLALAVLVLVVLGKWCCFLFFVFRGGVWFLPRRTVRSCTSKTGSLGPVCVGSSTSGCLLTDEPL